MYFWVVGVNSFFKGAIKSLTPKGFIKCIDNAPRKYVGTYELKFLFLENFRTNYFNNYKLNMYGFKFYMIWIYYEVYYIYILKYYYNIE